MSDNPKDPSRASATVEESSRASATMEEPSREAVAFDNAAAETTSSASTEPQQQHPPGHAPELIPPLKERHRRFVLEYVIDLNGRAAAIRAGYARRRAANTASELLHRPEVQLAIREEMREREKRLRLTAEQIMREAMRIAFCDPGRIAHWGPDGVELVDSDDLAPDDRAAVKWISVGGSKGKNAQRFELHDKLAALELLARLTGLLPRGPGGVRFTLPGAGDDAKSGGCRDANAILRERLLKIVRSGKPEKE